MTDGWMHLKSGSDVRGVAVGEPDAPATLTPAIGMALGQAFARWLAAQCGKETTALTVAVGRDSRVTGEALSEAVRSGMHALGVRVLDCGLCTTPAMFMATVLLDCDGAVMVTASHLPWRRNGYKFFTKQGGLDGAAIGTLLRAASEIAPAGVEPVGEPTDLLTLYTDFLMQKVREALGGEMPLAGLHVVVDAGNGAGGFYADMLRALGANTQGSQFLEPDGHFPNHIPNPEDPEAMRAISGAVLRANADLGVVFDTDCDRAALVDGEGREINRNRLIALVGAMLLSETPGVTLVSDSVTSAGLDAFISGLGGTLHRFKRGYRNVIDKAVRLNAEGVDCPLAIETSGHAALRENRFLDDGMYLSTRLIIQAQKMRREGRALTDLIAGLREPAEAREVRLTIRAEDFRPVGEAVIADVIRAAEAGEGQRIDPENREGVRIQFGSPDEWLLLRLSVHDPLLVINAESAAEGGVRRMLGALRSVLARHAQVDLSALDAR